MEVREKRGIPNRMHSSRVIIRPSHPYNAGTEHVGFPPTIQAWRTPSAKCREVFGESGGRGGYSFVACLSHLLIDHASSSETEHRSYSK